MEIKEVYFGYSHSGDEFEVDSPSDPYYDGDDVDKDPNYIPDSEEIANNYYSTTLLADNNDIMFGNEVEVEAKTLNITENEESAVERQLSNGETADKVARLTRKRKRCPEQWVRNVKKDAREHGQAYVNWKGKNRKKKQVRDLKNCHQSCKLKCSKKISSEEREKINKEFWI
ncbi:unnamed protein product [Brassicogethes aeneus]|uniref:Uncharacterized protein n=1 Tax=Brassicogethes aeneus TaxID=1431903 RepID=A0A9P0FMM5_BRAAE|nr:unnamed protein product [Brassicogethes aeneus]